MTRASQTLTLAIIAVLIACSPASAATRQFCFRLLLKDNRTSGSCPDPGAAGARRPCNSAEYTSGGNSYMYPVGVVYDLWDRDWSGGDDYIGQFWVSATGKRCVTFNWEGTAAAVDGEPDPDPYLVVTNRFNATFDGTTYVRASQADGSEYPMPSGRYTNFYNDCTTTSDCSVDDMIINPDTATPYSKALLAADSAQRMLQVYSSIMDTGMITIRYPPRDENPDCTDPDCTTCNGGCCAMNRTQIDCSNTGSILSGEVITHEMGHILQQMMFIHDGLTNDCSYDGEGHSMTSREYDSCATTEGWADYVAAVSWWDPDNTASEADYYDYDLEENTPYNKSCYFNDLYERQVMKAFWDLDDARSYPTETPGLVAADADGVRNDPVDVNADGNPDDDLVNLSSLAIATGWTAFPAGTGNHQDFEPGPNGVNIRDYDANFDVDDETFINHNCLYNMVP